VNHRLRPGRELAPVFRGWGSAAADSDRVRSWTASSSGKTAAVSPRVVWRRARPMLR